MAIVEKLLNKKENFGNTRSLTDLLEFKKIKKIKKVFELLQHI